MNNTTLEHTFFFSLSHTLSFFLSLTGSQLGASSAAAMNAKVAGKSGGQGNTQGTKALAALEGHYRCHVQNKATGQWFELQVQKNQTASQASHASHVTFIINFTVRIKLLNEHS